MDYDKTYLAYKNLGQGKKFEQLPDYNRYKKNPRIDYLMSSGNGQRPQDSAWIEVMETISITVIYVRVK